MEFPRRSFVGSLLSLAALPFERMLRSRKRPTSPPEVAESDGSFLAMVIVRLDGGDYAVDEVMWRDGDWQRTGLTTTATEINGDVAPLGSIVHVCNGKFLGGDPTGHGIG